MGVGEMFDLCDRPHLKRLPKLERDLWNQMAARQEGRGAEENGAFERWSTFLRM